MVIWPQPDDAGVTNEFPRGVFRTGEVYQDPGSLPAGNPFNYFLGSRELSC